MAPMEKIKEFTRQHKYVVPIGFIVLCIFVGLLGGKAFSATPDRGEQRMCRHNIEVTCASLQKHVTHFKHGRYGRVHGVHVRIFRGAPAKAAMMRKLARKMPRHPFRVERYATCAKAPNWVCANAKTALRGGTAAGHRRCMKSRLCRAYNRYGASANGATCLGVDSSYYHPSCIPYKLQHPGWKGFTKRQIQIGGGLVLCGAAVTAGVATGVGWVVVGIGGTTCFWNYWTQVDPG